MLLCFISVLRVLQPRFIIKLAGVIISYHYNPLQLTMLLSLISENTTSSGDCKSQGKISEKTGFTSALGCRGCLAPPKKWNFASPIKNYHFSFCSAVIIFRKGPVEERHLASALFAQVFIQLLCVLRNLQPKVRKRIQDKVGNICSIPWTLIFADIQKWALAKLLC